MARSLAEWVAHLLRRSATLMCYLGDHNGFPATPILVGSKSSQIWMPTLISGQRPGQMLASHLVVLPHVVGFCLRLGDFQRKGVFSIPPSPPSLTPTKSRAWSSTNYWPTPNATSKFAPQESPKSHLRTKISTLLV